jgi:hypothetical protein
MRRFLNGCWIWAEAYGTARAAAHLARLGMLNEARTLMEKSK